MCIGKPGKDPPPPSKKPHLFSDIYGQKFYNIYPNTYYLPGELFCSYVLHVISGKFGEGLVKLNVNESISPIMHDLPRQCKSEGSPAMAKLARLILAKAWSG